MKDRKEYVKKYYDENIDKISEYRKKYRDENKEKSNEYSNQYQKDRKKFDPLFKLKVNIRTAILKVFKQKGYTKKTKTNNILGCSFIEFKLYLEGKFESWMSWDKHGLYNGELNYGWDMDHIVPISSATTEEEVIKLNHYTNFQPLCSKINRYIKKDNIL
jgi:hypothetical protein